MRLEWLEDVVAVIETGSFNAAARRRNVTQPAFSRRIQAIEDYVGTALFDRERKPVGLKPTVLVHQEEIRRLVTQMKDLIHELRREGREAHNRIIIASQHALTATRVPAIVETLSERLEISVRLRSANRDECLALLMTRQADLVVSYLSTAEAATEPGAFLDRALLGTEDLVPVIATGRADWLAASLAKGDLPIVAYPGDVFLGRIFNSDILPRLPDVRFVHRRVETALTLAALRFAVQGAGVAWIPESIAQESIAEGLLCTLRDHLPTAGLSVAALRLTGAHSEPEDVLWAQLAVPFPP